MRARTLLLASCLAAAAAAQPIPYPGPVEQRDWHTALAGSAGFTQTVAGLLTGAGYPDAVILQNGTPSLLDSPAAVNSLLAIPNAPGGCTAMTVLYHERAPSGYRRDQLVVSTPTGLSRWARTASPQWGSLPGAPTSGWSGMKQLLAADLDGNGYEDLIGVSGAGDAVRVAFNSAQGFTTTGQALFSAPEVVHAVTTTRWTDDEVREIAVATSNGLRIYSFDLRSTMADVAGTASTQAILASPRSPSTGTGEVLVLAAESSGTWNMFHVTSTNPVPIPLGNLDLVACAVGDVDADGDDDLVFSKRSNHRATLFAQVQPSLFTTLPQDTMELPLIGTLATWGDSAGAAPANDAWPLLADFDGDGAADFLHPVETTKRVAIVRSPFGSPRSLEVDLANSVLTGAVEDFQLHLGFTRTNFPGAATHIECVVWDCSLGTEQDPGYALLYTLQSDRMEAGTSQVTIGYGESILLTGGALLVQLRPVRVELIDETEVVTRVWRPTTSLFAAKELIVPPSMVLVPWWTADHALGFTLGAGCYLGSGQIHHVGEISMSSNGGGSIDRARARPARAGKKGGDLQPSTNGGVNTGEIIIVEPPPPPDPPSGTGTGAGGSGPG